MVDQANATDQTIQVSAANSRALQDPDTQKPEKPDDSTESEPLYDNEDLTANKRQITDRLHISVEGRALLQEQIRFEDAQNSPEPERLQSSLGTLDPQA